MAAIFLPSLKTLGGNRVLLDFASALTLVGEEVRIYVVSDIGTALFGHKYLSIQKIGSGKGVFRLFDFVKAALLANKLASTQTVILSEPLLVICLWLLGARRFVRFHQADDYVLFDNNPRIRSRLALKIYKKLCVRTYRMSGIKNVFVSRFVAEEYRRHGGVGERSIANPGVNVDRFSPGLPRASTPLRVGIVARDLQWKGFADFCHAVRIVESRGVRLGEIVLLGHDIVSPDFNSVCRHVRPDNDADLAESLRELDIFVHASWVEGYGLPPLEAMACGCAVIVSDSGGPSEYAVDGRNCLLFEPGNPADLADKLAVLCQDLELRSCLQLNAVGTASRFSTTHFVHAFATILRSSGYACADA